MLHLIHSNPYVLVIGDNTRHNYYSNIHHDEPTALTRFLTYSSAKQHVDLVCKTQRMMDYLKSQPDDLKSYEEIGDEAIKAIRINHEILSLINKYKSQSLSNGLTAAIVQHSVVPLFYEAHFTINDLTQLRRSALRTDDPERLEFLNKCGIESLIKDAVRRMSFN
ncbi:hypothetical protein HYU21_00395 [Candidatus Woesearchaeota archaeon]|nr:hypothetical protein [Candidatus Woesearchaeota archaeon]